jgi:hypothetical protein
MNDTYIVKNIQIMLAITGGGRCNRHVIASDDEMACKAFRPLENELTPKKASAARLVDMKFLQQKISGLPGAVSGRRQQCRQFQLEHLCQGNQSTLCRNRRRVHSNRSARRTSSAPASAGWENTLRPRRFANSARSLRFFQPAFLESNSGAPASGRGSFRAGFGVNNFWVCARASRNFLENGRWETRGFTSCFFFSNLEETAEVTKLSLVFGLRRVQHSSPQA